MFKEIPGAVDRIRNAKRRNFKYSLVKMVYEVIAFFLSPTFVTYLHSRFVHMTNSTRDTIQNIIANGIADLTSADHMYTDQFGEKSTMIILANLIHEEKTMSGFRRFYMCRADKYVNPQQGMVTGGGAMTEERLLVYSSVPYRVNI